MPPVRALHARLRSQGAGQQATRASTGRPRRGPAAATGWRLGLGPQGRSAEPPLRRALQGGALRADESGPLVTPRVHPTPPSASPKGNIRSGGSSDRRRLPGRQAETQRGPPVVSAPAHQLSSRPRVPPPIGRRPAASGARLRARGPARAMSHRFVNHPAGGARPVHGACVPPARPQRRKAGAQSSTGVVPPRQPRQTPHPPPPPPSPLSRARRRGFRRRAGTDVRRPRPRARRPARKAARASGSAFCAAYQGLVSQ